MERQAGYRVLIRGVARVHVRMSPLSGDQHQCTIGGVLPARPWGKQSVVGTHFEAKLAKVGACSSKAGFPFFARY